MDHDLLVEPLLTWRDTERRRGKTTLPGLLARLATGELGDFARVRAHQFHPWCMFLTQLAAIALHRAGSCDPRVSDNGWRDLLLGLTGGRHEPWALVVEDLAQPAYFQPPVPEGTVHAWKRCASPDDLDILVTAKNHDVKAGVVQGEDLEGWVYAITTLQTMQGYPGRGYTRVARMKGGYGNRPRVGRARDHGLASRFLRDVEVLLTVWPGLLERGYRDDGVALVWTEPWDGGASLAMGDLAPHFIEVCWRVRCRPAPHGPQWLYTTTRARRCLPEVDDGDVGDPWIPVGKAAGGALTVGSRGFDYRLLVQLLFEGDFEPAAAQKPRQGDGDPVLFLASALARGQGKTEGLHERALSLSGDARLKIGQPDTRASMGKRATERVASADRMRSKVLFPALKQIGLGDSVVDDEFTPRVDDMFFDHLFAAPDQSDPEAKVAFDRRLAEIAWAELQRAIERCSVTSARRFKAISEAEGMFRGCLKKNFPDLVAAYAGGQGATS